MSLKVWVDTRGRDRHYVVEQYEHDREPRTLTAAYTYPGAAQKHADEVALEAAVKSGDPVELFRRDAWVRIEVIR